MSRWGSADKEITENNKGENSTLGIIIPILKIDWIGLTTDQRQQKKGSLNVKMHKQGNPIWKHRF